MRDYCFAMALITLEETTNLDDCCRKNYDDTLTQPWNSIVKDTLGTVLLVY